MTFTCVRKECIEDLDDAYHYETHECFVCGEAFMPVPMMAIEGQCQVCGWYKCPTCEQCKCNLSENDQEWIDDIHKTYCKDVEAMATLSPHDLTPTENPFVREGLGLQLLFCKRWAAVRIRLCTDSH